MKSWKANYAAILIAQSLAMVGFGLSFPIIPLFIEEDIGIRDPVQLKAWVGVIQSSASITMAVFAPIWGHLADVFSRKTMLLRAMFGGAILILLMAFVRSPWQMLALRAVQGCLSGTIAAATVMTAGIVPASQVAFALGLLQTGIAAGNSLGPLAGGVLSDFLGNRIAFLGTGVVLFFSGFIVLKWVDNDRPKKNINAEGIADENSPGAVGSMTGAPGSITGLKAEKKFSLIPDFRPIIANPLIITLMMVGFSVQAVNGAAQPMLPLFLKSLAQKITDAPMYIGSSTGLVLGVGAATSAIAAVLVGKYALRLGYWRTLIFCLAACAVFTVPQAFVNNMYQLMALRAISSFCLGGCIPVMNAIIAISTDRKTQGTTFGLNSSVSAAGMALGPLIGSAAAMLSYRAVFIVCAFIMGFAAVQISKRRKSAKD